MLALATGWTPDVLAELPLPFRAACHWALYAQAICGPEGFPDTTPPSPGADPKVRLAIAKQGIAIREHRALLFPDDD